MIDRAALRIDTPGTKRRCHKWAMVGWKGGKCVCCGSRVTEGNIENFHFDHKVPVNNAHDKNDRWSGAIRDWPPFTDRWFAWGETVDLICKDCHEQKHRANGASLFAIADAADTQRRLEQFDPGPTPTTQLPLLLMLTKRGDDS